MGWNPSSVPQRILKIVDDNSGGLKLTKLVVEISEAIYTQLLRLPELDKAKFREDPSEWLFKELKKIPEIGVLEYEMQLGAGMTRQKWFVYRKVISLVSSD